MIVRDEAKVLARCLDSLRNLDSEICVVDTGSVDETVAVAERFGARVKTFTGCNGPDGRIQDFAAARNAALEMATCDWVLQIDADEILEAGSDRIQTITEGSIHDYIGVKILSEGAEWTSGRLFKRMPNARYVSRIHEYLIGVDNFGIDRAVTIRNLPDKEGKESSAERNMRLCLLAIEEAPSEARIFHFLGNEYRAAQKFDNAILCYRRALQLGTFYVGLFHTTYYLAVFYVLTQSWDEALDTAIKALQIDPRYAEVYCLLGDIYCCRQNEKFAKQWYKMALSCEYPPQDAVMGIQAWAYGEYPRRRLMNLGNEIAS